MEQNTTIANTNIANNLASSYSESNTPNSSSVPVAAATATATATADNTKIQPKIVSSLRVIKIPRNESGYGFTLSRTFLSSDVQEDQLKKLTKAANPTTIATTANENEAIPILKAATDTKTEVVFVKHVKEGCSAYVAGLREGDCPISVDNVLLNDKSYSAVVSLIENSGAILELAVIPSFIQLPGQKAAAEKTANVQQQPSSASTTTAPKTKLEQAMPTSPQINKPTTSPANPTTNTKPELTTNSLSSISPTKQLDITTKSTEIDKDASKTALKKQLDLKTQEIATKTKTIVNVQQQQQKPQQQQQQPKALGTGVGALLYSYLNPSKAEANQVNQFNINSPRMSNTQQAQKSQQQQQQQNDSSQSPQSPQRDGTQKKATTFKFLDSSAFSAFSKDKLKNLQDALAKHYTNDQLKQLGIIVNKNATIITQTQPSKYADTTFDSRQYAQPNQQPQQQQNRETYENLQNFGKPQSSDTHDYYNRKQQYFNNYNKQPSSLNSSVYQSQHHQHTLANKQYQSPSSQSSYSPASSSTGYAYPPYTSPGFATKQQATQQGTNESAMLNAVAAAAAACNKNSPQLFSKYIESVHKAMHGNNTTATATTTTTDTSTANEGSCISSDNNNNNYTHTKFVEQCRQMFDSDNSPRQAQTAHAKAFKLAQMGKSMNSNNIDDYGYIHSNNMFNGNYYGNNTNTNQQAQQAFFYNTYQRPSLAQSSAKSDSSGYSKIAEPGMRASSVGFSDNGNGSYQQKLLTQSMTAASSSATAYANPFANQQQQQHFQHRSSSSFNHFNRASYKGECKRLMSRTNMESVAERASRFEEIDFDRYNRLKAKYGALDLGQQYENDFANQLQMQRYLRLGDYKYLDSQREKSGDQTLPTGTYSPPYINPGSQIVDSVNDYLYTNRKMSQPMDSPSWRAYNESANKFYPVGSSITNSLNNNNVKSSLITNQKSSNKMLSNFVGGISSSPAFQQPTFMDSVLKQQQQQKNQQFFLPNNMNNRQEEDILFSSSKNQKSRSTTSPSPNHFGQANQSNDNTNNRLRDQIRQTNNDYAELQQRQQYSQAASHRTRQSKSSQSTNRSAASKTAKSMLHYNFSNYSGGNNNNNLHSYMLSSDAGETTSTDSDIGTSPSGTTIASPPSSPQQQAPPNSGPQRRTPSQSNSSKAQSGPNNSIIRQHSYLHAVQLNDFKIAQPNHANRNNNNNNNNSNNNTGATSSNNNINNNIASANNLKNYNFTTINEHEIGPFLTDPHNMLEPLTTPYYYSPSSTVIRQQRLLKQQQEQQLMAQQQQQQRLKNLQQAQQQLLKNNQAVTSTPTASIRSGHRSKSGHREHGHDYLQKQQSMQQDYETDYSGEFNQLRHIDSVASSPLTINQNYMNTKQQQQMYHQQQQQQQQQQLQQDTTTPNMSNDDMDEMRRLSYLTANRKHTVQQNSENVAVPNNKSGTKTQPPSAATPIQHSRHTSIKKLKNFFGERTPVVLQAVETKNVIASDDFLAALLETIKEGVLNCKIVCKDGKRSTDRSWRPAWAVLKKSGALFLCKEKKDNIMIPSVDSYPIDLKHSVVQVAHDYTKRKNVFKVNTFSNSEYLFQTCDQDAMMDWIREMQDNSLPPDLGKLFASHQQQQQHIKYSEPQAFENNQQQKFPGSFVQQQQKSWEAAAANANLSLNSLASSGNEQQQQGMLNTSQQSKASGAQHMSYSSNLYSRTMNTSADMMVGSSPDEMHGANQSQGSGANPSNNMSPMLMRKAEDNTSPRRDNSNRKWVRQMTKRLKDFMTNTNTSDISTDAQSANNNSNNSNSNNNDYLTNMSRNFGIALDRCECSSISQYVPVVVELCTRLIELHINDEGIYRKVGQKQVVNSLRAQLNRGILNVDVSDYNWDNPHAVVSLLKCFLNELPDSLSTSQHYTELVQISKIDNHPIRLLGIKKLLHRLSNYNFETLKYLSAHLRRVAASYQTNKMTVKNLCIAFSQSIIRHNEASCETIKADHMNQSLIIELMLIYHDWLFESSMETSNVPEEVKEPVESALFQAYCVYQEPTTYSDVLVNTIKSLRTRWNSTISSMNSHTSNTVTDNANNNNAHNSTSQGINNNNTTGSGMSTGSNELGSYSPDGSSSASSAVPRPMNIQFRSKQTIFRSFKSSTKDSNTPSKASKNFLKKDKKQQKEAAKDKNRSRSVDAKSLEVMTQKRAVNMGKSQALAFGAYKSCDALNAASTEQLTTQAAAEATQQTKQQYIDFKLLEKRSEEEREKLNRIMKKLEVDLINAKIDLLEEDYSTACENTSSTPLKSKPSAKASLSTSCTSTFSSNVTSGIVATTGPSSSSSSSVSTSPPLQDNNSQPQKLESSSSPSSSNDRSIRLMLVNKPRQLPKRRHTITAAVLSHSSDTNLTTESIDSHTGNPKSTATLLAGANFSSSSASNFSTDEDEMSFESLVDNLRSRQRKAKATSTANMQNQRRLASKSISNLSGSVEKSDWIHPQQAKDDSSQRSRQFSHQVFSMSASSPGNQLSNNNEKIVLNLSPLSLSASSITSSSDCDQDEPNNKFNKEPNVNINNTNNNNPLDLSITTSSNNPTCNLTNNNNNKDPILLENFALNSLSTKLESLL